MAIACQKKLQFALFGFMVLMNVLSTSDALYNMNQTCAQLPDGTFVGNPNDCTSYGYCKGGSAQVGYCPKGMQYNMRMGGCVDPSMTTCGSNVAEACSTQPANTLMADPTNCQRYCNCTANFNEKTDCASCPPGYYYDKSISLCNWPSAVDCPADSICRLVPDNTFVGSPEGGCGYYEYCRGGVSIIQPTTCKSGQTFIPSKGECVMNSDYCTPTQAPGTTPPPTAPSGLCPADATTPGFEADRSSCYGYYDCAAATKPHGYCPYGLFFEDGKCVLPYDSQCNIDRCQNNDLTYVAQPGCKTFKYCGNGLVFNCQTSVDINYPYFNEATQACEKEMPAQPICTGSTS